MTSRLVHVRVKDEDIAFLIKTLQSSGIETSGRTAASLVSHFLTFVRLGLREVLDISEMKGHDATMFVEHVLNPAGRPEVEAARVVRKVLERPTPAPAPLIDWHASSDDGEEERVTRTKRERLPPYGTTTLHDFDVIAADYPKDRLIENGGQPLTDELKLAIACIYHMIGDDMYGTTTAENSVRALYDAILTYRIQEQANEH